MKRFLVGLILLLMLSGCRSEAMVSSGTYYAQRMECNFEGQTLTIRPYLGINAEDQSFYLSSSAFMSSAETGTYQIKNSKLIAETQNTTLVFEIKDPKTLILVDDGGWRTNIPPINTAFVLSEQNA